MGRKEGKREGGNGRMEVETEEIGKERACVWRGTSGLYSAWAFFLPFFLCVCYKKREFGRSETDANLPEEN